MEIGDGFVRNSDLDLTHEYIDEENDSENEFITVKKRKEYILILMMRTRKYIFLQTFKSLCFR